MLRKITVAVILLWFAIIPLVFAETSLKAEVDKQRIATDEDLTYKLVITSSDKNIPAPQFPKFTGFKVISQAQTSEISLAQGALKSLVVYVFILLPQETGKFKIEPSQIVLQGKTYASEAFEIEVIQGKARPKAKPPTPPSQKTQPETDEDQPQVTL